MPVSDIYPTTFDEDVPTKTNTNHCPECDGRVTPSGDESVCEDCGLVVDERRLDRGPEWGGYDEDECRRTGGVRTVSRHDRGLSTTIGHGTDSRGNQLSRRKRRQLARMRREHSRGQYESKADRNLMHGFTEIRRIVGALSLGDSLRDQACSLFRTAQSENLLRGRSIEGIAAACVYAAIRCNGLPRTLDEVATLAQVSQSRVKSCYKSLNAELGLPAKPMTPSEFVPQLASDLDVPDRLRRRAREYARRAQESGVTTGVRPSGFAAACLYKAGESTILTQDDVAEAADTTPVTVRTHWQTLNEVVD
ncbi:transcription initiation factor IIB [Haloarchaeobius iranensis]|uniref:Transcription initiation factor TFIIB n=1 Tax=Haloarchaeobius iranensis TaxID=996166 RepID=A0A1H0C3P2_9EURY|nr:transcription initiation factor IIB family protein [Haloarchaeobius iranensis]SDN52472.1 transcription initiation factor TFIIB [Haloarchaeobius iranensis]